MPPKYVRLDQPGIAGSDDSGVRFNALAVSQDEPAAQMVFTLDPAHALVLGRDLVVRADEVLAARMRGQTEMIEHIEERAG
jgi:hypothetical protein